MQWDVYLYKILDPLMELFGYWFGIDPNWLPQWLDSEYQNWTSIYGELGLGLHINTDIWWHMYYTISMFMTMSRHIYIYIHMHLSVCVCWIWSLWRPLYYITCIYMYMYVWSNHHILDECVYTYIYIYTYMIWYYCICVCR